MQLHDSLLCILSQAFFIEEFCHLTSTNKPEASSLMKYQLFRFKDTIFVHEILFLNLTFFCQSSYFYHSCNPEECFQLFSFFFCFFTCLIYSMSLIIVISIESGELLLHKGDDNVTNVVIIIQ